MGLVCDGQQMIPCFLAREAELHRIGLLAGKNLGQLIPHDQHRENERREGQAMDDVAGVAFSGRGRASTRTIDMSRSGYGCEWIAR